MWLLEGYMKQHEMKIYILEYEFSMFPLIKKGSVIPIQKIPNDRFFETLVSLFYKNLKMCNSQQLGYSHGGLIW